MNITTEYIGFREIEKVLESKVVQPVKSGLIDALTEGGKIFEDGCKEHCPVDTGTLRDSIDTQAVGEDEVDVAPHTDYATYVELGTYKMDPQPYMRFGYETKREEAIAAIGKVLAGLIK